MSPRRAPPPARAAKRPAPAESAGAAPPRRRAIMVKMDEEVRNELEALAQTRRKSVQELGLEAICDLLRKHGRPVSMRNAFRRSAAAAKAAAAAGPGERGKAGRGIRPKRAS